MAGGTICIPTNDERMSDLQGFVNRARISIGLLPPAALEFLEPGGLRTIQLLGLGGEATNANQLQRWKECGTRFANCYGPTECCVMSTINTHLTSADPSDIGKPVGGSCWVCDPNDTSRLLPCGLEGELVVTGANVAEGYLDEPEKTAKAFVTPTWPEWAPQHVRAYRTGDLAVLDRAGTLRIRGRIDRQIKFYGQRIERTELEQAIASCGLHNPTSLPVIEKIESCGRQQLVCFGEFMPQSDRRRCEID